MGTPRLHPGLPVLILGFSLLAVQATTLVWAGPVPADAPPAIEFRPPVFYAAGDAPGKAVAGDFNADGHLDLAITNFRSNDISVLLGRGDGTFMPQTRALCGPDPFYLVTADFDADGDLDLGSSYYGTTGSTIGFVCVAVGRGDGSFDPGVLYPISFHATFLVTGDFDGDGRDDLAAGGLGSGLTILPGRADGTLAPENLISPDTGFGFNSVLLQGLVAGEMNGDGLDDLANSSFYASECGPGSDVGIGLALGGGAFHFQQGPYAICASGLGIGDLNGDGLSDLASIWAPDADLVVDLHLNLGNGSFGPESRLPEPEGVDRVAFGDFNADGVQDILLETPSSMALSARPGLTPTSFGERVTIASANVPVQFDNARQVLAIGDFDEDGSDDLAVPQETGDSVGVLLAGAAPANLPPTAAAGLDVSAECASPAGASVHMNGSGSSDPDSSAGTDDGIAAYDWLEDFGLPTQAFLGSGPTLDAVLSLGPHLVTLRVTDTSGSVATDDLIVAVVDTTPPALSAGVAPGSLWPPHHQMTPVHVTPAASDRCGGSSVVLAAVASSEPDDAEGAGDGSTTGDIQDASVGTADFDLLLRAERQSKGGGRTYTLTYRATDASGNSTETTALVQVPQSH